MDEDRKTAIASAIITASWYFKIPISQETIRTCLQNPNGKDAKYVCRGLKVMLKNIIRERTQNRTRHRHFWKNLVDLTNEVIGLLSGEAFQERPHSITVPQNLKISSSAADIRAVLRLSTLQCPVPAWFASPEMFRDSLEMIAEGGFSQIFKICGENGESRIVKVIPVERDHPRRSAVQLSFSDVITEIYSSVSLSKLSSATTNCCSSFPKIYRICVTQDRFPKTVEQAWRNYQCRHSSTLPNPADYGPDQAFVTIETDYGGINLASKNLASYVKAESVFRQVAAALAVAEEELCFEHRDLHVDNVLVKPCSEQALEFKFKNAAHRIETHGVKATIIDFTFSRMGKGKDVKYLELDHIYNIRRYRTCRMPHLPYLDFRYVYSEMEKETRSNWKGFYPKTNILWLKHIVQTFLQSIKVPSATREENLAQLALRIYNKICLSYDSASQLTTELIF